MNWLNDKTPESHECKRQLRRSGVNIDEQNLPVRQKSNAS